MEDRVYLDYSASMPTDERVVEAMAPYFTERFGNPSSLHREGGKARAGLEEARKGVADLIGASEPSRIIFTSGATESNNLAIKGLAREGRKAGGHIVTGAAEHQSILGPCGRLEKGDIEVTYLPVDDEGRISADDVAGALRDDTLLVSLGHANNEVGTIQDIAAIARECSRRDVSLHVDAVPTAGRIPVDVEGTGIDLLTLSSNDLYGPKGVGALYVTRSIKLDPLLDGGGQERRMRSGTENVPGIVGMGEAARIAKDCMVEEGRRLRGLRDRLIDGILENIPASHLNGPRKDRVPQNANLRFSYIEGEALILNLDMAGIATSTSSACTSKTLEASHVLKAMGISHEEAHSALLFNLGRWSREGDVDRVLEELPDIVRRLREMSPLTPKGLYD